MELADGPVGADVILDGTRAGTLPLSEPVRVAAGTVSLEVRAPGHYPLRREVVVRAGQTVRESATLRPVDLSAPSVAAVRTWRADLVAAAPGHPAAERPASRAGLAIGLGVGGSVLAVAIVAVVIGVVAGARVASPTYEPMLGIWRE